MFRICESPSREEVFAAVEERLLQACAGVLRQYVWEVTREMREAWAPMMALLLRELLALGDERVRERKRGREKMAGGKRGERERERDQRENKKEGRGLEKEQVRECNRESYWMLLLS